MHAIHIGATLHKAWEHRLQVTVNPTWAKSRCEVAAKAEVLKARAERIREGEREVEFLESLIRSTETVGSRKDETNTTKVATVCPYKGHLSMDLSGLLLACHKPSERMDTVLILLQLPCHGVLLSQAATTTLVNK